MLEWLPGKVVTSYMNTILDRLNSSLTKVNGPQDDRAIAGYDYPRGIETRSSYPRRHVGLRFRSQHYGE